MADFQVQGPELKKLVRIARKGPISFAFNPGKSDSEHYLGMDRRKSPELLGKAAKADGPGPKAAFGTCTIDGTLMRLKCERELPALAKRLKKFLKSQKITLNVEVLDADGNMLESDIEDGLAEDPDLAVAGASGEPPEDGQGGDDGPPDDPATAPDAEEDPNAAIWQAAKIKYDPLVAQAVGAGTVDPSKLRAAWAAAVEAAEQGNFANALAIAKKVAQAIERGGGDQHKVEGAADPNLARWAVAKGQFEGLVNNALGRNAGNVGKIRAVWQFALEKAENENVAEALKALVMLKKLLGEAAAAAPEQDSVPEGTVAEAAETIVDGKALLAELGGLVPAIKAAIAILADRAGEIKGYIGNVKSGATGNDLPLARQAMDQIRAFIGQADQFKANCEGRYATAQASYDAAIARGTGDLDQLRAVWGVVADNFAKGAYGVVMKALDRLEPLIAATAGATDQVGEATSGVDVKQATGDLDEAANLRTRITQLAGDMAAALRFVPDSGAAAQQLVAALKSASSTGDLGAARAALASYEDIISSGNEARDEIIRRRDAAKQKLETSSDPDGASEEEKLAHEAKREAVRQALADEFPTPANLTAAEKALAELGTLLDATKARIIETKRKCAALEVECKTHNTDVAHVLGLEGETKRAQKLQRELSFAKAQFGKLLDAQDIGKATAMLGGIVRIITALKAEEAEIDKAKDLRDQVLAEYNLMQASLKSARTIYAVSPDFEADIKAFGIADRRVSAGIKNREYAKTFGLLDVLERLTNALVARKSEFNTAVRLQESATLAFQAADGRMAEVNSFPKLLPDVKVLKDRYVAALDAGDAAWDAKDWALVQQKANEADALATQIMLREAECRAQESKRTEAERRFFAAIPGFQAVWGDERVTPEFNQRMDDYSDAFDAYQAALDQTCDMDQCLVLVGQIEQLLVGLDALKTANDQVLARNATLNTEYAKVHAKMEKVFDFKPYTPEGLVALQAFEAAWGPFDKAFESSAADAIDKLAACVIEADKVIARIANEDSKKDDARAEMQKREGEVIPKCQLASPLVANNRPALDDLDNEIQDAIAQYTDLEQAVRYLEAVKQLDVIDALAERILAKKVESETATALLEPQFQARWTRDFINRVKAVLAYKKSVKFDVKELQDDIRSAAKNVQALKKKSQWHDAMALIDLLEPMVVELESQKPDIDSRIADADWINAAFAKEQATFDTANSIDPVTREIKVKVDAYKRLNDADDEQWGNRDYAAGRAGFAALLAAAQAVAAVKSEYDSNRASFDQAVAAWKLVSSDVDDAYKISGLTPELKKLVVAYRDARSAFYAAWDGFDYVTAKARVPAYGAAAKAVLAAARAKVKVPGPNGTEVEVDAYDKMKTDADDAASDAELTLDAISPDDLKNNKTSTEKVALLDALRGQNEKLTDKQRELQRKIYAAMDLDPEFVTLDDQRRDTLLDEIRKDEDLTAAKSNWATIDIDQRVRLLQKTLATECKIYGMPVPTVQTFEEPPGDLGSFNPGTNVIRINVHPLATFDDFHDTLDTIVHENAHNYQDYLVTQLNEGLINPGDPEYKQAVMFAANSVAQSYVDNDENPDIYKKQPLEEHAWKTGAGIKDALQSPPPPGS